jgi:hypothetical protein
VKSETFFFFTRFPTRYSVQLAGLRRIVSLRSVHRRTNATVVAAVSRLTFATVSRVSLAPIVLNVPLEDSAATVFHVRTAVTARVSMVALEMEHAHVGVVRCSLLQASSSSLFYSSHCCRPTWLATTVLFLLRAVQLRSIVHANIGRESPGAR